MAVDGSSAAVKVTAREIKKKTSNRPYMKNTAYFPLQNCDTRLTSTSVH